MPQEDSRLKGYFVRDTRANQPLERTFCVNCGEPKGWVTNETSHTIRVTGIIAICDDCELALGEVPLLKADIKEY